MDRLARSLGWLLALVAFVLPLGTACRAPTTPTTPTEGDPYLVTGTLTSNACAPGLDPIDPLVFATEIRAEDGIAYWRIGGQPWIPGTLDRTGHFHFTVRTDVEIYPPMRGTDPDFDPGTAGCTVSMIESIDGRIEETELDGGVSDAQAEPDAGAVGDADASDAGAAVARTFEATNRIELVPHSGSDCSRALLSAGGAFPSLPCAAEYSLVGDGD